MSKINKYYLVKLEEDITQKPRYYSSTTELKYGDHVMCVQKNGNKYGHVVGTLECSKNSIKRLVEQVGGTYPLADCCKIEIMTKIFEGFENGRDLFVVMGVCNYGENVGSKFNELVEKAQKQNWRELKR